MDDITFLTCSSKVNASIIGSGHSISFCEGDTTTLSLNASVSSGYNAPEFQWQQSKDNGTNWENVQDAKSLTFVRKPTSGGSFLYRLTVAERGNTGLSSCRVVSNNIKIEVYSKPRITLDIDP